MAVRIREFIAILQNNVELVNEIAKFDSHSVSYQYLVNLIEQLYSPATKEALNHRLKRLCNTKPFPVLTYEEETDEFLLAPKVANLVLWLSNNLHLASHRIIKAIIDDINDSCDSISEIVEEQPINLFMLKERMNQLSKSNIELAECAGGNLRSIGTKVQEFKEEILDFETKQIKARLLMDDHLTPMREIIDPDGPMIHALESAASKLSLIQSRNTIPLSIRENASNLQNKLINNQRSVRENHWSAYSQLQPILAPYLRPASDLVKGASIALSIMNKRGVKSLRLYEDLRLTRSTIATGIYDDEHLEIWFQRNKSRDFSDEEISFTPGTVEDLKFDIPIIAMAEKIVSEGPVEDLLSYLLEEEIFQKHTLSNCNNAATDILIEINDFEKISIGEIRQYRRGKEEVEVRKIAVK